MSWINETFANELAVAVVGGVLVFVFERLASKIAIPWYRGKSQRLPNLNGTTWNGFEDNPNLPPGPHSTLRIWQFGNRVRAEAVRNIEVGQRSFNYRGEMQSGQILLTFNDVDGPGYIIGAMVLHIEGDLKTLTGASTYYHHTKGRVVSTFRTYKRIS